MSSGTTLTAISLTSGMLLFTSSVVQARGAGTDYFLLSPDGKLLCQYQWQRADHVDVEAELVYRVRGDLLTATPFAREVPLWKMKSPLPETDIGARHSVAWQCAPGIVALITRDAIHAFDSKTGAAKYAFSVANDETLRLADFLQPQTAVTSHWNRGSYRYRYLAIRTDPPGIAKFDLCQGRLLWEQKLPAAGPGKMEVGAMAPGVAEVFLSSGKRDYFLFDDATGALLTKLPKAREQALQIMVSGNLLFYLSSEKSPTLTAFDSGTQKAIWSIADLAGVSRFVGDHQYDRLLCAAEKQIVVIDTRQRRVTARLTVSGLDSASLEQTESALLMEDKGALMSIDPATGKTNWKVDDFGSALSFCVPQPSARMQNQFLVVKPPPKGKDHLLGIVEARSIKDGSAGWNWQVPPVFGDSTSIQVRPCPSGYLIQRNWLVLD